MSNRIFTDDFFFGRGPHDWRSRNYGPEKLTMPKPTKEELRRRFFYQPPPDKERINAHEQVSNLCFVLAMKLNEIAPAGRNHSLMLTALEDVRMRGNAALACDSVPVSRTPAEAMAVDKEDRGVTVAPDGSASVDPAADTEVVDGQ